MPSSEWMDRRLEDPLPFHGNLADQKRAETG
jgi:hypothetical protein